MDNMKNNGIKWSLALIIVLAIVTIFGLQAFKSEAAPTSGYLGGADYSLVIGGQATLAADGSPYGFLISDSGVCNGCGNVGLGTTAPLSRLSVGGNGTTTTGIYVSGTTYGIYGSSPAGSGVYSLGTGSSYGLYSYGASVGAEGEGGTVGVYGQGDAKGVYGQATNSSGKGIYGRSYYGVAGVGTYYGVYGEGGYDGGHFLGDTGVYASSTSGYAVEAIGSSWAITTNGCSTCSVLAEMVKVSETPDNGDVMCLDPDSGLTQICREDKSYYLKGIAQKYAESIMRMGCSKATDSPDGENFLHLGIMDVDAWKQKPECQGWYPIALSGLSEQTNVVCHTPQGKPLRYGDILVSSSIPGHLRPLDEGESVEPYQIAGQANSLCQPDNNTDSIMVWVK